MGTVSNEAATRERSAVPRAEFKLMEESFLTDDFVRQLISVGEVDIMVGLPTHNNAKTVGSVVTAIQDGILQCFPRERAVIINADAESRDGTSELVVNASIDDLHRRSLNRYALRTLHSISTRYGSSPAPGTAMRTILAAAELLRARACAVISAESTNIKPDWLQALLRPIYKEDFDLVLPTYSRHKFDGLLMTNLLYPMTRALYGARIREPYASEFAFSDRLASQFLAQNLWNDDTARGCEVHFTIAAIAGGCRIAQSFLGSKPHVERHASDLIPALRQTVGGLFSSIDTNSSVWSTRTASQLIPTTGPEQQVTADPMRVNRKRLYSMFCTGVGELQSVFQSILSTSTLAELQRIARLGENELRYPAELWVRTVYEFAAAYHRDVISRDHIIQALAPLFRGRAFTFLAENRGPESGVENQVESLCLEFERQKPYLLELWNSRE